MAIWGFALRLYTIFPTSFLNDLLQSVARVCGRDMAALKAGGEVSGQDRRKIPSSCGGFRELVWSGVHR
jgi:hypothetical protein